MKKFVKRLPIKTAAALLALAAIYCLAGWIAGPAPFEVHFIDVGQADCALVMCGGENMLIDGGDIGGGPDILDYLNARGVDEIDILVITHGHADHIGGLEYIISNIPVETAYISSGDYSSDRYDDLLHALKKRGVGITKPYSGWSFELGEAECTFLSGGSGLSDDNDASLVLMTEYMGDRVLFTGDIETEAENKILSEGRLGHADILKVAHHGSDSSSCRAFLDVVSPEIAVISVGRGNSYRHPDKITLSKLADCKVYRTDRGGHAAFASGGDGFILVRRGIFDLWIMRYISPMVGRLAVK